MICSIDIETYSETDLSTCGVYRYVEDPHHEILLIGYAIDDGPVNVIDFKTKTNLDLLPEFKALLDDPAVTKTAYNAQFEITNLSKWIGHRLDPARWQDTMVWAAYCGLPRSLKEVGEALGLGEDKKKLAEGKALVRYFCQPCNPTKSNGGRTRNLPEHDPDKWHLFVEYNRQDVVAERAIRKMIEPYKPPESEHDAWVLDQAINARGVLCDRTLANSAVDISRKHTSKLLGEMKDITHLENPNSTMQLGGWLGMKNVTKETVAEELKTAEGNRKRVLTLRQEVNKSSVKKYQAMQSYMCHDDRCRGLFQFYGANRSGRFAGRGIQLQNLPQNHIVDLEEARKLVRDDDYESLELLYGNTNDILSQCIRTAFIPKPGCVFAVADFSAIEARVIAWVAGEQWRMDLFASGGDIYCQSASRMFNCEVVKHGVNGHLRARGKVAELGCGFGGSVGALINMGAVKLGLTEEECLDIVTKWREASPHIVQLWWDMDNAIKHVLRYGTCEKMKHDIEIWKTRNLLHIQLPGGRCLRYYRPKVVQGKYGRDVVEYQGYDLKGKWGFVQSYGPKFVENCIAEGTIVLTNHGTKPIENISDKDLIWDGVEWVTHEGLIDKGRQECVCANGIWMTPDHEILTQEGWVPVGKADKHNWAETRAPDCHWKMPGERQTRLSLKARMGHRVLMSKARLEKQVYDIRNCGKRHRFCVVDEKGCLRIVHNCVQGIARDCLIESMKRVAKRYPDIVMHVHDEMIVEVPKEEAQEALGFICSEMGRPIEWAPGLLLRGDGYLCDFYKKD